MIRNAHIWPDPGDRTLPTVGGLYRRRFTGTGGHVGRTAQVVRIDRWGSVIWRYLGNSYDREPTAPQFFNARFEPISGESA